MNVQRSGHRSYRGLPAGSQESGSERGSDHIRGTHSLPATTKDSFRSSQKRALRMA